MPRVERGPGYIKVIREDGMTHTFPAEAPWRGKGDSELIDAAQSVWAEIPTPAPARTPAPAPTPTPTPTPTPAVTVDLRGVEAAIRDLAQAVRELSKALQPTAPAAPAATTASITAAVERGWAGSTGRLLKPI